MLFKNNVFVKLKLRLDILKHIEILLFFIISLAHLRARLALLGADDFLRFPPLFSSW